MAKKQSNPPPPTQRPPAPPGPPNNKFFVGSAKLCIKPRKRALALEEFIRQNTLSSLQIYGNSPGSQGGCLDYAADIPLKNGLALIKRSALKQALKMARKEGYEQGLELAARKQRPKI